MIRMVVRIDLGLGRPVGGQSGASSSVIHQYPFHFSFAFSLPHSAMSATLEKELSAVPADIDEKPNATHVEHSTPRDLVYEGVDEEPEFTARTWIALASLFVLNLVQVIALTGPPAIVSKGHASQTRNSLTFPRAAVLYRSRPAEPRCSDLGPKCAVPRTGRRWARNRIRLGHLSSSQDLPC
jgi:hypothetical protein